MGVLPVVEVKGDLGELGSERCSRDTDPEYGEGLKTFRKLADPLAPSKSVVPESLLQLEKGDFKLAPVVSPPPLIVFVPSEPLRRSWELVGGLGSGALDVDTDSGGGCSREFLKLGIGVIGGFIEEENLDPELGTGELSLLIKEVVEYDFLRGLENDDGFCF